MARITTTTAGAAISGLTGGGGGGLGTLMLRLIADSNDLLNGMAQAEQSVLGSAASMTTAAVKMGGAITSVFTGLAIVALREFAKFESSFVGVRKTVDGTDVELNKIAESFRNMAKTIPVNVNEINAVGEAAGQLGIKKENIVAFTKTMLQLSQTTKLTSDEAATGLARFANITGMSQTQFDKLANTIYALDKSLATTAPEIVNMGLRLAGAGTQVGLTNTQILSFAAAMSSVGVQAELGGTAMSQMLLRMSKSTEEGGESLKAFAKVCGMTGVEFTKAFTTDAAGTMIKFIEGVKKMHDSGDALFGLFKNMHLDGVRVVQTLLSLSSASGLVKEAFETGAKAWQENKTLAEDSEKRYATFASQIQLTVNQVRDLFISIGEQLSPSILALNNLLKGALKDSKNWGTYLNDSFINDIIPAMLTAIGMVGDAINGWRMIIKTIEVAFNGLAEVQTEAFGIMAKAANVVFEAVTGGMVDRLNLAITAMNLFRSKANQIAEVPKISLITDDQFDKLDEWDDKFHNARIKAQAELTELAGGESFSKRVLDSYDHLVNHVKEKNKEIVDNFRDTTAEVAKAVEDPMKKISEQATKVIDDMFGKDMPGYTMGRGKKKRYTGLLGPGLGQFEDKDVNVAMQFRNELAGAKEKLKALKEIEDSGVTLTEETQKKKLALIEAYNQKVKALQMAELQFVLGTGEKMFSDLTSIAEAWGGKQSAAYKAMFAVSKAFAIADAIVKIQQGIAGAFSLPWPANLAAAASVVAATASIVTNIQAVTMNLEGKARGGPVMAGRSYIVGERGQEVFSPSENGTIIPNHALGGGKTRVVINNYTDAKPEVHERQEGAEKVIEIAVRRAKEEMSSDIRDGHGAVSKSLESTYRLRRGT